MKFKEIAHYFLGHEIKIGSIEGTFEIEKVSQHSVCIGKNINGVELWYKASHCKPVLIPMHKISDEDKKKRDDIFYANRNPQDGYTDFDGYVAVIHFLLSKGYNVFNLPESEFIDTTTANKKKGETNEQ